MIVVHAVSKEQTGVLRKIFPASAWVELLSETATKIESPNRKKVLEAMGRARSRSEMKRLATFLEEIE